MFLHGINNGLIKLEEGYGPALMKSLLRTIEILKVFENESQMLRLTDIVAKTGLHKTSTHRMLGALVKGGLVSKVDNNRYRLNIRPPGRRRLRIGYGMQSGDSQFTKTVSAGFRRAALAADVDLFVLDNQESRERARENAHEFVKIGVDLVVESQTDVSIAVELSQIFSDGNIPVIALEIPLPGAVFYGADNVQAGMMAGRYLTRWAETHWKDGIDELLLLGIPKAGRIPNARIHASMLGVVERLAWISEDQVKTLATTGHYESALSVVKRHIKRNPHRRVLVSAINDTTALGALHAFREQGREGDCAVVGQNASAMMRAELIRPNSRFIGAVGYFPERYGSAVIPLALDILQGRRVQRTNFVKHEMITPQNVQRYYPARAKKSGEVEMMAMSFAAQQEE